MPPRYTIAVRSLCEFTAKSGDLAARFTPSPTAQQGIAGHLLLASRRGSHYEREIPVSGSHKELQVRGRADGYDRESNRLEEFKTHRGDLARMAPNQRGLHWAQLKMYGALLCMARGLSNLELALVYLDIKTEEETTLTDTLSAGELQAHFTDHCERFLVWAHRELAHRRVRDHCLTDLKFPFGELRSGQRQMAEAVYKNAMTESALMVQAPTGIGKTLGTLFPLLKAVPKKKLDKVLFLVAKTPGRRLALDALEQLLPTSKQAPLRVLEMVAKESACHYPGRACEAESCPLARGFYDRLAQARQAALEIGMLDQAAVRRVALESQVCPYFLTQELVRWCDVIVGDYNYYFDSSAILHALTAQNQWRIALLVDEAHNLLARGRDMYSATLAASALDAAHHAASAAVRPLLRQVRQGWHALHRVQREDYAVYAQIPDEFLGLLHRAITGMGDDLAADPSHVNEELLRFHFDALHFCRMADSFGNHSLFDVTLKNDDSDSSLCIRNINPAPFLGPRFSAATAAVLFSATLAPEEYYRQLLGLPEKVAWMDVDSPFAEHQLDVRVERRISTRYRDREASLGALVELIARQYRARPGNYLAFFGSFEYLQAALTSFKARFPEVPVWEQVRGMPSAARDAFLARFTSSSCGVGFAVLGGAFAEGIDLPGTRLIGAFIATLGLPQVNEINTEIERRMQALFNAGYEYTYLYPGLQKVVQAAGRVIRTPTDQGTLYLIDDRYMGASVRRLLPEWWRIQCR
jgi:DNA excision repair protein ERCC-2